PHREPKARVKVSQINNVRTGGSNMAMSNKPDSTPNQDLHECTTIGWVIGRNCIVMRRITSVYKLPHLGYHTSPPQHAITRRYADPDVALVAYFIQRDALGLCGQQFLVTDRSKNRQLWFWCVCITAEGARSTWGRAAARRFTEGGACRLG